MYPPTGNTVTCFAHLSYGIIYDDMLQSISMKKILVVDDDHDLLFIVQQTLKKQGYRVVTLPYGKDIVKALYYAKADLLILDINLGDSDGRVICCQIKDMEEFKDLPIILFSGEQQPDLNLANCKADAFFSKPFVREQFVEKINDLLAVNAGGGGEAK